MNGASTGMMVAGGLVAAALIGLVFLARSNWLQSDTLKKCVVLSVGVHLLLAAVAAGIGGMRPASWGTQDEGRMTMMVVLTDEPVDEVSSAPIAEPVLPADAVEEMASAEAGADANEPAAEADAPPDATASDAPTDLVPLLESVANDIIKTEASTAELSLIHI